MTHSFRPDAKYSLANLRTPSRFCSMRLWYCFSWSRCFFICYLIIKDWTINFNFWTQVEKAWKMNLWSIYKPERLYRVQLLGLAPFVLFCQINCPLFITPRARVCVWALFYDWLRFTSQISIHSDFSQIITWTVFYHGFFRLKYGKMT